jgi:hypothetical protein
LEEWVVHYRVSVQDAFSFFLSASCFCRRSKLQAQVALACGAATQCKSHGSNRAAVEAAAETCNLRREIGASNAFLKVKLWHKIDKQPPM